MLRSFAWAVGWRTGAALLAAALLWHWLPHPWEQALTGLLLATLVAVSFRSNLVHALRPVEDAIRDLGDTHRSPAALPPAGEFAPLRSALHEAHLRRQATEAQTTEERRKLQGILDSMPEAVAALDSGGRLQWMNVAMRQLLPEAGNGGGRGREFPSRLGHALVHVVRDPDVLAASSAALEGHAADRRARTVLPGRTFEVNAAPMPEGGAVVILRDVTPAEQMERTQRDFVANVSHELRTPLTSITGFVQTLLEEIEEQQGRAAGAHLRPAATASAETSLQIEFLTTVLRNAERMNLLIDDLLELSRVESGEHPVHPIAVPAAVLVQEALTATAGLLPENGSARLELGFLLEATVMADPDATIRVLTNLLENALKYGRGPTETRVVVSVTDDSRPGTLCFSVRDWGSGIASEHQDRLFERFYRVDKARSRESGGTGLGLAIARGLINAQGGEIWCESDLGRGSNFRFTLPLAPLGAATEMGIEAAIEADESASGLPLRETPIDIEPS